MVCALLLLVPPAHAQWEWPLKPTPVGAGAEFHPPSRWPLAGAAANRPLNTSLHGALRVHLELFAERKVVIVPGGIGVSGGRTVLYGHVVDALWRARAWTLDAGGVIHLERSGLRLSDVFSVWGQPLDSNRLLGFHGPVSVFINGRRHAGPPGDLVLGDRDQVVVQINGYIPPHSSFVFARDRR